MNDVNLLLFAFVLFRGKPFCLLTFKPFAPLRLCAFALKPLPALLWPAV
jgi:hypothetical protein